MPELIQRSFTGGEISPSVQARADVTKYATGLNLCQNFIVKSQGGVYSRPGTRYIDGLSNYFKKGRLIPFSFNTEQTYILVFEENQIKVLQDGAFVETSPGVDLVVTSTYTEAEIPDLDFAQSADVMTITHPNHDPANFSRLSATSFTLTTVSYAPTVGVPEFTGLELSYTILTITNANPPLVTTSAAHGFVDNSIADIAGVAGMTEVNGRKFRVTFVSSTTFELDGEDASGYAAGTGGTATRDFKAIQTGSVSTSPSKAYYYVVTAVDADGVESLPSELVHYVGPALSVTSGVRLTWGVVAGADYYRVYKDPSIYSQVYGWIGDSNNNTFDDFNIAPLTSDSPPEDRQPFTGADNNPSAVNYYQQRQVFANTNNEPQSVYTTQVGNFNSLRTSSPARDDDAVTFTIVAQQVNEIRHILSLDSLILLTSGGEWIVTEGQDRVLTPSTIGVRIQSYNGSAKVKPAVINSTALYVQEKGTKIRDLGYEFSSDKYTGNDLSIMAEHLFKGHQITEMAYADEPYGVLWCVRDDGVLLGLTYQREHQVWAWHQHITDGLVESVATISEDGRDALYMIVNRTINGLTRRYIERMEIREETTAEECFYVDSGVSYDEVTPTTVFAGLIHLKSKDVVILADGNVVTGKTVSIDGDVTLDVAASKVHIGLPYTPAIETLDIDVATSAESVKSNLVSVSKVVIEVENTRGGWVGPRTDVESNTDTVFREIPPRFTYDSYDAIALKTYKQEVIVEDQWSRGGGIRIEQREPLPMAILSVIPQVDVSGS